MVSHRKMDILFYCISPLLLLVAGVSSSTEWPSTTTHELEELNLLDCDFDAANTCHWTQDQSDEIRWGVTQGYNDMGPNSDHTSQTTHGYYLYFTSRYTFNAYDRLVSRNISSQVPYCMTFYYFMYGGDTIQLNVYLRQGNETKIWTRKEDMRDEWIPSYVQITNSGVHQIVIEAVGESYFIEDVAIDDIKIIDGICLYEAQGDVRFVEGTINSGRVEILINDIWRSICATKWNFTDANVTCVQFGFTRAVDIITIHQIIDTVFYPVEVKCVGNEIFLINCSVTTNQAQYCEGDYYAGVVCDIEEITGLNSLDCNFDAGNTCLWKQDQSEMLTITRDYFGLFDHTSGRGYYVWMAFGSVTQNIRLVSRNIPSQVRYCMAFYYIMFEDELNVYLREGTETKIWSRNGQSSFLWNPGYVQIINSGVHQIIIEMVGNSSDTGFVGIDDIKFNDGKCLYEGTFDVGTLRLVGGSDAYSGRVEVFLEERWGPVCDDTWGTAEANVVCNQLGFGNATLFTTKSLLFGESERIPFPLQGLECDGTETYLTSCNRSMSSPTCQLQSYAGVVCENSTFYKSEHLRVSRLVTDQQRNDISGIVIVSFQNQTGAIHENGLDKNAANVVCRELKKGTALGVGNSATSYNVNTVYLSGLQCYGNETLLSECLLRGIGVAENTKKTTHTIVECTGDVTKPILTCPSNVIEIDIAYNNSTCYDDVDGDLNVTCDIDDFQVNNARIVCTCRDNAENYDMCTVDVNLEKDPGNTNTGVQFPVSAVVIPFCTCIVLIAVYWSRRQLRWWLRARPLPFRPVPSLTPVTHTYMAPKTDDSISVSGSIYDVIPDDKDLEENQNPYYITPIDDMVDSPLGEASSEKASPVCSKTDEMKEDANGDTDVVANGGNQDEIQKALEDEIKLNKLVYEKNILKSYQGEENDIDDNCFPLYESKICNDSQITTENICFANDSIDQEETCFVQDSRNVNEGETTVSTVVMSDESDKITDVSNE